MDRDYERARHFLHLDGFAFFGDVAAALAERAANLAKAAEDQAIAEWRAFMRTAQDEEEISIERLDRLHRHRLPAGQAFNEIRLAS